MENETSNIKERILQIAKRKRISYELFFDQLGMSYGNFKGKAKRSPLNSDSIANILSKYPEIDPHWLLLGEGNMFKKKNNIPGEKNNIASKNGTINEQSVVGGNLININDDADCEKIIGGDEIEIKEDNNANSDILRKLDTLTIKIESLERELKSKDKIIESLIEILGKKTT